MIETINYEEYCRVLLQGICRNSEVRITKHVDAMGVLLVASGIVKQDMGTAIGREGKTISSIRNLVHVAGVFDHARVGLKILEAGQTEYIPTATEKAENNF